jgi:hypothetical protein
LFFYLILVKLKEKGYFVEYLCVQIRTRPSLWRYTLKGSNPITTTYNLKSYLNPLSKCGLDRYSDMMWLSFFLIFVLLAKTLIPLPLELPAGL